MKFLIGFVAAFTVASADIWTETGTVPDKLAEVPPPLYFNFGDLVVEPNDTISTTKMLIKPTFEWADLDPNALYTFILEDNDINTQPIKYCHWLVVNIPGDDIFNGQEIATYLPPYHFHVDEETGGLETSPAFNHRYLALVYKQNEPIERMSGQAGCNKGLLEPPRISDHDKLKEEYNLEGPVAGNFFRVGYTEGWTEYFLCYFRYCLEAPWVVVPGVNDMPECINENEESNHHH